MALVVKDRVRETSTTTGTGTITLAGAVTGYQAFSAIGDGNTTYYTIYLQGSNEWEVGIGTYTASGTTLSRDTILASSNGGSAVNFSAGTKDVFVTYPAGRSVWYDTATNVTIDALTVSNNTILGDASTDTVRVNGYMGVGGAASTNRGLSVINAALSGAVQSGIVSNFTATSAATTQIFGVVSEPNTAAAAFTAAEVTGVLAANVGKGAGSTITNQYGVRVADQTQGANNFGVASQVSSGSNKWNLYASGTARNYLAGALSVGTTTDPGTGGLYVAGNTTLGDATTDTVTVNGYMSTGGAVNASFAMYPRNTALTGTTQAGVYSAITGASDATSAIYGVVGDVRTAAAAFTVTNVSQFFAADATKGAGSTITNQHGIRIADQTQGTNNYGVTSLVSSGTNKWNIYASGTAQNYFAGNVGIGTSSPSDKLQVTGGGFSTIFTGNDINFTRAGTAYITATGAGSSLAFGTANTVSRMLLDASGNLGLGVTPSAWGRVGFEIGVVGAALTRDTRDLVLLSNAYWASGGLTYAANAAAGRFDVGVAGFKWYTAPSGTAGNLITFTQAMTLNASGNLGIGETNPGQPLVVSKNQNGSTWTQVSNTTSGTGAAAGVLLTSDSSIQATLELDSTGYTNAANMLRLRQIGAYPIGFFTSDTERARIDSAGTVFMRDGTSTTNTNSSRLVVGGTISETVSSTQYLVASQYDIGTAPNDIPLNQYLGSLAYQDASSIAGQVGLSAGTAALPSLVSATDTDTGMWFPAANTLAWSTNGAEKMRLDSSGNLGIGTTAAQGPLEVAVTGATVNQYLTGGTGNNAVTGIFRIGSGAGRGASIQGFRGVSSNVHSLDFYAYNAGDVFGMRLDSSGNLGIGTASPAQRLHVATTIGNAYMRVERANQSTGQVGLQIAGGTSSTEWFMYIPTSSNTLTWFGNSTNLMYLDTSGNLGIGAASPAQKLEVQQSGGATVLVSSSTTGGSTCAVQFKPGFSGVYGDQKISAITAELRISSSTVGGTNAITTFYNGASEAARITSGGDLLVGTTTSSGRLTVQTDGTNGSVGFIRNTDNTFSTDLDFIKSRGSTASPTAVQDGDNLLRLRVAPYQGSAYTYLNSMAVQVDGTFTSGQNPPTRIVWSTNAANGSATERARFTSGGNFLVGATTSSWSATYTALQLVNGSLANYSPTKDLRITSNAYSNSGWKYLANGSSSQILLDGNSTNGIIQFFSAATGTAGNATTNGVNAAGDAVLTVSRTNSLALEGAVPAAGTGITFPATQSASSNANTLDDYEEGNWTPGISFGTGTTGITYGAQSGSYIKIGSIVTAIFNITLTNKGSSTGDARVTGLPFTTTSGARGGGSITYANAMGTISNCAGLLALVEAGQTYFNLRYFNNSTFNSTALTEGSFANTSDFWGIVTYTV